jgi:uncharacterized protein YoxC
METIDEQVQTLTKEVATTKALADELVTDVQSMAETIDEQGKRIAELEAQAPPELQPMIDALAAANATLSTTAAKWPKTE